MSVAFVPPGFGLPNAIAHVSDQELDTIRSLWAEWQKKHPRNVLRSAYFEGKNPLKPTGNIPREAMRRGTPRSSRRAHQRSVSAVVPIPGGSRAAPTS